MISVLTPRMEAALEKCSHDELQKMMLAMEAEQDEQVWQMLIAKDMLIVMDQLLEDPLFKILNHTEIQWGDLMLQMPQKSKSSEWREIHEDEDWVMPVLRLRKHIWENFPVNVVPIQSKDNRERYAVQWHTKKFQEARDACEHGWQYMDFEDDTYRRLMKALSFSRFWTVEQATGEHDLCTIAMNFQEEKEVNTFKFTLPSRKETDSDTESVKSKASLVSKTSVESDGWQEVPAKKPAAPAVPVLRRLNDIKTYFPVVWSEVQGCKSTTYAIEIFGKKVKEQGLNMNTVKTNLLAALKASKAWNILPAKSDRQVCLLQMNHL